MATMKMKMESMVKGSKMKNMHSMRGKIIIKEEITIMMLRSIRRMKKMKMERAENKVRMMKEKMIMRRFQMLNKLREQNSKGKKMMMKMTRRISMIKKK